MYIKVAVVRLLIFFNSTMFEFNKKKMQPKIEKITKFKYLPPKITTINFVKDLKKTKYVLYQL